MVNEKLKAGHEKGLTLIELLVTLAIVGFVLTAIYSFYLTGLQSWHRAVERIDKNQNARIAMDKIIRELRYANEVTIYDHGREIRFRVPHDSLRTLRFRLVGSELVFDSHPTGSIYYFNTKVALQIENLQFYKNHQHHVIIKITAGGNADQITLRGSVYPRNLPPLQTPEDKTLFNGETYE